MAEATLSRYIARYDERPEVAAEGQHWHQSSLFESTLVLTASYHLFIFDLPIFRNMCNKLFMNTFLGSALCPWRDPPLYISHIISFVRVDSLWISTIWYVSFLQFLRWALRKIAGNSRLIWLCIYVDDIYTYIFNITRTYFYGNRTRKGGWWQRVDGMKAEIPGGRD
jgi:hypothetical protein